MRSGTRMWPAAAAQDRQHAELALDINNVGKLKFLYITHLPGVKLHQPRSNTLALRVAQTAEVAL